MRKQKLEGGYYKHDEYFDSVSTQMAELIVHPVRNCMYVCLSVNQGSVKTVLPLYTVIHKNRTLHNR